MSSKPDATFSGDPGDEYEESVRRQRAENAALLAELNLQSGGSFMVDPAGARSKRLDAAAEERKRKRISESRARASAERKKRKTIEQAAGPQRASARLAGRTPAGTEEENKRIEEGRRELERKREEARKILHDDHSLQTLVTSREQAEKLEAALRVILVNKGEEKDIKNRKIFTGLGDPSDEVSVPKRSVKDLQAKLDQMQLLAVKKATPKRIYTAAFHPSVEKDIIFTGDKEGYVSVWEPFALRDTTADDEENESQDAVTGDDGNSWSLRIPHDSSPISCLKIPTLNPSRLYFSSYNSTLRRVDLEKGVSEQVFSFTSDQDNDDYEGALLSVFDFSRAAEDGNVIWCGDHRGGVIRIDAREPASVGGTGCRQRDGSRKGRLPNWKRWQLCEKKIGGLSINPLTPSALAVASLDQSVRVFDIRRLSSNIDPISTIPTNYRAVDPDLLSQVQSTVEEGGAQLGWRRSRQASTSVDFGPDGRHLAAVSYDDVVKVWNLERSWFRADEDVTAIVGAARGRYRKSGHGTDLKSERKGGLMKYFKKEEVEETIFPRVPVPTNILSSPLEIPHNNQTGKWLTLLRARWCGVSDLAPHFTIGSMSRSAEIWSSDGKLLRSLYDEEHVSAVPAVTNMHPLRVARLVTGNASGKCTFWGIPGEE